MNAQCAGCADLERRLADLECWRAAQEQAWADWLAGKSAADDCCTPAGRLHVVVPGGAA